MFYNVFYGGAASGKSVFVAQRIIFRIITEPGHNFLVIRKVDRTNRDSTFALIIQVINTWGLRDLFHIRYSDMTIQFTPNGSQIIFKGLDDPEKIKSITFERGILTNVWIEEATQLSLNDFVQLRLRLRGRSKIKKQITLTFNPISHLSWAKKYFFDKPPESKNYTILKTTYKDNNWLEPEDKEIIEQLKDVDPVYYAVYALGNWGVLGNLVFTNYVIENFAYIEDDFDDVYIGMDFGFKNPSAIEKIGFKDGEIYFYQELYAIGLTNDELITKNEKDNIIGKREYCTADSAEPDRIKEWRQAGYNVHPAKKGKDSIRYGIDYLKRHRIHIHRTRCPGIAEELPIYKYKEDKDGNVVDPETPAKYQDHGIDAVRYATERLWSKLKLRVSEVNAGALGF